MIGFICFSIHRLLSYNFTLLDTNLTLLTARQENVQTIKCLHVRRKGDLKALLRTLKSL